jgi:hypothetical protein
LTHTLVLFAIGLTLAVALPAVAQKIYKQQLPDGSVVYADHRIKGAKLLYLVTMPEGQAPPSLRADAAPPEADGAARDKRLRERASALDRVQRETCRRGTASTRQSVNSKWAKSCCPRAPKLGHGWHRVLPEYYDRIKKLEDNVAKAQVRPIASTQSETSFASERPPDLVESLARVRHRVRQRFLTRPVFFRQAVAPPAVLLAPARRGSCRPLAPLRRRAMLACLLRLVLTSRLSVALRLPLLQGLLVWVRPVGRRSDRSSASWFRRAWRRAPVRCYR